MLYVVDRISENWIAFVGILGCDILLEQYILDSHWLNDILDPVASSVVMRQRFFANYLKSFGPYLHFDFTSYTMDLYSAKLWLCMVKVKLSLCPYVILPSRYIHPLREHISNSLVLFYFTFKIFIPICSYENFLSMTSITINCIPLSSV